MRRRSGSETRQRGAPVSIRFTADERQTLDAAAERAGLTVGAYVRTVVLGVPGPRAVRRPPVERVELARLLGAVGRLGGTTNRLAHAANRGHLPARDELLAAAAAVQVMRSDIRRTLGRGD